MQFTYGYYLIDSRGICIKYSRRSFFYSSIGLIGLVGAYNSLPLFSQNILKLLEDESFKKDYLKFVSLSYFQDLSAAQSFQVFDINHSYGRLSTFSIDDINFLNADSLFIITKGPKGLEMKSNFPNLNIIGNYTKDLSTKLYITDSSPHYWNSIHKNLDGRYKTYLHDTITRPKVSIYMNIYTEKLSEDCILELKDKIISFGHSLKQEELAYFEQIKLRYPVKNFEELILSLNKKLS